LGGSLCLYFIDKLQLFNFSFNFQLFPELSLRACYHVFTGNKGTAGAFPQPAAMFIDCL
jgi:hypothetical protein